MATSGARFNSCLGPGISAPSLVKPHWSMVIMSTVSAVIDHPFRKAALLMTNPGSSPAYFADELISRPATSVQLALARALTQRRSEWSQVTVVRETYMYIYCASIKARKGIS